MPEYSPLHPQEIRRRRRLAVLVATTVGAVATTFAVTSYKHPQGRDPHQSPSPTPTRLHQSRPRPRSPSEPIAERGDTSLAVSFQRATHRPMPSNLETFTVPWTNQTWAIDPIGITMAANPNPMLWFGKRVGTGPWRWIPSTLPGALNPALPKPIDAALQLAWDLNQGQAGPNLGGPVQWSAITGHVGMPAGWTMQGLSAADSPFGQPTLVLTIWMQSFTGSFPGFYGVATAWDATNAFTGHHGLLGLEAIPGPLRTIAHTMAPSQKGK